MRKTMHTTNHQRIQTRSDQQEQRRMSWRPPKLVALEGVKAEGKDAPNPSEVFTKAGSVWFGAS